MLTSNQVAHLGGGYHKGHQGHKGHEVKGRGGRRSAKSRADADSTYVPKPGESSASTAASLSRILMAYEREYYKQQRKRK
jgi:hypothetical protein